MPANQIVSGQHFEGRMNKAEVDAVAQAITDAHAHQPGEDRSGRLELAKSIIAAVDAITTFRATKQAAITEAVKKVVPAKPVEPDVAPPAIDDVAPPSDEPESNVTPIKKKGKKA